ncbi:MAG TPA: hypothetical protein PLT31_06265 [Fibrobacteraceae bacterium]|nr:hypothetical protein [Fibrobacteraceae bacterium]
MPATAAEDSIKMSNSSIEEPYPLLEVDDPIFFFPWNIFIGGGLGMFSVGLDLTVHPYSELYATKRPDSIEGMWNPPHILLWANRARMIYDFYNHQYGFFLQPNIQYFYDVIMVTVTLGPEIGWQTETGFDYGASIRIGGFIGVLLGVYEFGYLVNAKRFYFNFLFNMPIGIASSV